MVGRSHHPMARVSVTAPYVTMASDRFGFWQAQPRPATVFSHHSVTTMKKVLPAATVQLRSCALKQARRPLHASAGLLSNTSDAKAEHGKENESKESGKGNPGQKKKKTQTELDEELRSAMEGMAGDGGLAGAELEGGKAVTMKRGVRDNMFRYI